MRATITERIIELLKVKSIITIITFFVFAYLSIIDKIDVDNFMFIMGMITTYFFNKDTSKT